MQGRVIRREASAFAVDRPVIDVVAEPVNEVNLVDLWRVIRQRLGLFLLIVLGVTGAAIYYVETATPLFTATGQVMIDNRYGRVSELESVIAIPTAGFADVPDETIIMSSPGVAQQVIERLRLWTVPEFNPWLATDDESSGPFREVQRLVLSLVSRLTGGDAPEEIQPVIDEGRGAMLRAESLSALPGEVRASVLGNFAGGLEVISTDTSRVVQINYTTQRPELTAQIVNTLMQVYLERQEQTLKTANIKATEWLREKVADLRRQMDIAEANIQDYRTQGKVVGSTGGTLSSQQMSELSSQLVTARAEEAAAAARLGQARRQLQGVGIEASPDILGSPAIQGLRAGESELTRRVAELATRYGDKHPEMLRARAELRDLQGRIRLESGKIIEALASEVAIARSRVHSLEEAIGSAQGQAVEATAAQVRMQELETEAAHVRSLYETFVSRLAETSAQQEIIQPYARIVSTAEMPFWPSFPRKGLIVGLALLGSLLLGLLTVFAVAALRRGFETNEELEIATRQRFLGIIPHVPWHRRLFKAPEDMVLANPYSPDGEALQNLRSSLYFADQDERNKSVLFTSSLPAEGKTTLALSYARFCGCTGQRVVIIDCDLARPRLHTKTGLFNDKGVADVLMKTAEVAQVVQTDSQSGVDVITSGNAPFNATDLLTVQSVRELLDALSWDYDVIVIDSSPILAISDAALIAKCVDRTVMLVQWRRTAREAVRAAVRRLESFGIPAGSVGMVLTKVKLRKYVGSGATHYAHYRRHMQQIPAPSRYSKANENKIGAA